MAAMKPPQKIYWYHYYIDLSRLRATSSASSSHSCFRRELTPPSTGFPNVAHTPSHPFFILSDLPACPKLMRKCGRQITSDTFCGDSLHLWHPDIKCGYSRGLHRTPDTGSVLEEKLWILYCFAVFASVLRFWSSPCCCKCYARHCRLLWPT